MVLAALACGWAALLVSTALPLAGATLALVGAPNTSVSEVATESAGRLAVRSVALAVGAAATAAVLGLWPAICLATAGPRGRRWLPGLALCPLLIPPQTYAYAWSRSPLGWPQWLVKSAVIAEPEWLTLKSALITGLWLWPVVSLLLASGWRREGRAAFNLALLDARPAKAFTRGALPSLRPYWLAGMVLVAVISLLEYAIPHLSSGSFAPIWATELLVLFELAAPAQQVVVMAAQVVLATAVLTLIGYWALRRQPGWLAAYGGQEDAPAGWPGVGKPLWAAAGGVWLLSVGVPVGLMLASIRRPEACLQAFTLLGPDWLTSAGVALAAGTISALVAWAVVAGGLRRWTFRTGAAVSLLTMCLPPALLGLGLVQAFNRENFLGSLYTDGPAVWIIGLVGRYAGLTVLVCLLSVGRQAGILDEQAAVDGAGRLDAVVHVLSPLAAPSLVAGAMVVAVLSLFEVVVTQMVRPVGYPSIAITILGHMHYGRDDVVIAASLAMMIGGVAVSLVVTPLLERARR